MTVNKLTNGEFEEEISLSSWQFFILQRKGPNR